MRKPAVTIAPSASSRALAVVLGAGLLIVLVVAVEWYQDANHGLAGDHLPRLGILIAAVLAIAAALHGLRSRPSERWAGRADALDALPVAVCIVGPAGDIEYANAALVAACGDVRRRKCRLIMSCSGAPGCALSPHGADARGASSRAAFQGRDGRSYQLLCSPMRAADAIPSRIVVMLDQTERRETESALQAAKEAAEAANRSKTEFLASMSHELRTPLNAIIGFADVMRTQIMGPLGNDSYVGYATDIGQAGNHLLELINDILDISRIEMGKTVMVEDVFAVEPVVQSALNFVRERAAAGGLRLACHLPADLPPLRADRRQVMQILVNLLSNAAKFTEPGGRIEVAARRELDGGLNISVRDTGIGIAREDIPLALSPFGQIDSPLSRRHKGTGLGLPLSAAMMQAHGGTLALESVAGTGTRVTLSFPATRVARETAPA